MNVQYIIYNPAGNITALVIGDDYNLKQRKQINDAIMKKELDVEQVGFLSKEKLSLTMAGGEFCGNATRCAAYYYIKKQETIELDIDNYKIKAGMDENKNIWCEIPIEGYQILKLNEDIYKVILKGITILVINNFKEDTDLKEQAKKLIEDYNIDDKAIGVMFIDKTNQYIKMYPIVWVKNINTLFCENACGSGTIAVTMIETLLSEKSNKYCIMQPSGEFLEAEIIIKNKKIIKAILKGKINTDNQIRTISIKD